MRAAFDRSFLGAFISIVTLFARGVTDPGVVLYRLVRLFGVGNYHPQDCGSNPKTRSS